MTLVEVDVAGAKPHERGVDLLVHLLAGKSSVAPRHREEQLRREDVRVTRTIGEHLAEKLLRLAARVHVRRVDEVDADVESLGDAGSGLPALDAAAVGQPRAEAELRHLQLAGPELSVAHGVDASR